MLEEQMPSYGSSIWPKNIGENLNQSSSMLDQRCMSAELSAWLRQNELLLQRLAWLMS